MRAFFQTGTALLLVAFVGSTDARSADPKPDAAAVTRSIDDAIQKRLDAEKLPVSPLSSDAEFLRRVSLDIAGVIPSPEQVTAFLGSKDRDKRAKLIDELLDSLEYARRMSDIWKGLL